MMGHMAWGLDRESPILCLLYMVLNDIGNSESLVGVKSVKSVTVIGYQADEYTHLVSRIFCFLITHIPWVHR